MIDLKGFSEFLGDVKHQFWIDISIYPWRLIFKNKCSVFAYKQVGAIKIQWPPIPKATNGLKLILCNTAAENFEKSVILKPSRDKVGINEKRTWVWLISRIWVSLTDIYLRFLTVCQDTGRLHGKIYRIMNLFKIHCYFDCSFEKPLS